MAESSDIDKLARVYAQLVALKRNLPMSDVGNNYVLEYHRPLGCLEPQYDMTEFKIPEEWVIPTVTVVTKDYKEGKTGFHQGCHVPRDLFLTKVDGVLNYFDIVGANGSEMPTIEFKKPAR